MLPSKPLAYIFYSKEKQIIISFSSSKELETFYLWKSPHRTMHSLVKLFGEMLDEFLGDGAARGCVEGRGVLQGGHAPRHPHQRGAAPALPQVQGQDVSGGQTG